MKSLAQMASEVFSWCSDKGWEPEPEPGRTFGDEIALIHSEASEALEAYRDVKFDYRDTLVCKCEPVKSFINSQGRLRRVGLDFAFKEKECKCLFKPDDVASEFADILIRLLHYSVTHGFDLEAEYERKMAYNRTRAWRHGGRNL